MELVHGTSFLRGTVVLDLFYLLDDLIFAAVDIFFMSYVGKQQVAKTAYHLLGRGVLSLFIRTSFRLVRLFVKASFA